jgi:hypothetical protein
VSAQSPMVSVERQRRRQRLDDLPFAPTQAHRPDAAPALAEPLTADAVHRLQRTAGNAAVSAMLARTAPAPPRPPVRAARRRGLQRAVVAIHGAGDNAAAREATEACLQNLGKFKGGHEFASGARGQTLGPDVVGSLNPPVGFLGGGETLYILGHGALDGTVAGMGPAAMAAQIKAWFGGMNYAGKIKLVACVSAMAQPALGGGTFANALAQALHPAPADTFRPATVDGIVGVGWVDEETGEMLSIDLPTYLANINRDPDAFREVHIGLRRHRIRQLFGAPVAAPAGGPVTTGKGPTGKVRYPV